MKYWTLAFSLFLAIPSAAYVSKAGHEGNGGDAVEAYFIQRGLHILNTLSNSASGRQFLDDNMLSLQTLRATLDYSKIDVTDLPLNDNTGGEAEAIGGKDMIILQRQKWLDHIEMKRDVDHLIFHEILRSAAVPDDNYVISNKIFPLSQFSNNEEVYKLSNYINADLINIWFPRFDANLPGHSVEVRNLSRSVQIEFQSPWHLVTKDFKNFKLDIEMPVLHSGSKKLILTKVECIFESMLGYASIVSISKSLMYSDNPEYAFRDTNDFWYPDEDVIQVDRPNLEISRAGSLRFEAEFKFKPTGTGLEDNKPEFFTLRSINFYFDIQ